MSAHLDWNATLTTGDDGGSWTYAVVPDSGEFFGTRKPVKVTGTVDDVPIAATLLPLGDGTHMLPLKASVRSAIGKEAGDSVHAVIQAVDKA